MLLVHQSGSVKIGEVIRYTITYTPSSDRILPTPEHLHLKIKNTCAIPLRAAWIHGPYALHVSAYPSTFNPHRKVEKPDLDGVPQYEPMLKAGGSWQVKLRVPDDIRESGADLGHRRSVSASSNKTQDNSSRKAVTWVVEISSQILFSTSASVEFEVYIGRDERSLDLGYIAVAGHGHGGPGRLQDVERNTSHATRRHNRQSAGVYSKAIKLVVEDTEGLWNKPALPTWGDGEKHDVSEKEDAIGDTEHAQAKKTGKQKKIHLVIVTHGLHSNTGADLLFLKESVDATVKQARKEKIEQKRKGNASGIPSANDKTANDEPSTAPLSGGQEDLDPDDDDEEQTVVRGFTGNAAKTENGIQYLGKRLAKYILKMTHPDQPFLPLKKSFSQSFTDNFRSQAQKADRDGKPAHLGSSVHQQSETTEEEEERAYRFTSISFIGHSLGGLIQTYAIAYIQKHSPTFFDIIEPVNFICMAAPMLGLSNENPMYVKFALDFGLVGRTGQDLGLTWRPPHLAKGGWNALIAGLGAGNKEEKPKEDPSAKPLLRILPTGPAHHVLRKFRNRTLYSNVVNDGIVPLRTSCLLFLDWRGLGKVEKARRENGLIGTMAEWGWAELTGANQATMAPNVIAERHSLENDDDDEHIRGGEGDTVPQPSENETTEDSNKLTQRMSLDGDEDQHEENAKSDKGVLDTLLGFFRPSPSLLPRSHSPQSRSDRRQIKALKRAQTVQPGEDDLPDDIAQGMEGTTSNPTVRPQVHHHHTGQIKRPSVTKGDSLDDADRLQAPPKTSIFESAGDLLHPPLPSTQWITDPSTRARTIFHDRVYHPEDIPPIPVRKQSTLLRRLSSGDAISKAGQSKRDEQDVNTSGMKIEEKIARAYHRDLSWRKVLVRLEPDAHNNMIVRRMFANAYGWPVIKHLCDTHFANTYAAQTRDEAEPARERAMPVDAPIAPDGGEEVKGQTQKTAPEISQNEMREAEPELPDLKQCPSGQHDERPGHVHRQGSIEWDDTYLEGSDDDNSDVDERGFVQRFINPHTKKQPPPKTPPKKVEVRPMSPITDGHRGLAPISPVSTKPSVSSPAVALTGGPGSPLLQKSDARDTRT